MINFEGMAVDPRDSTRRPFWTQTEGSMVEGTNYYNPKKALDMQYKHAKLQPRTVPTTPIRQFSAAKEWSGVVTPGFTGTRVMYSAPGIWEKIKQFFLSILEKLGLYKRPVTQFIPLEPASEAETTTTTSSESQQPILTPVASVATNLTAITSGQMMGPGAMQQIATHVPGGSLNMRTMAFHSPEIPWKPINGPIGDHTVIFSRSII